tara:strand:+ start:694 stop:891 length:198 start_codon:yes stop_codon:yes gene_type:complete
MSYTEIKLLPVNYRKWFIDKIIDDAKSKEDDSNTPIMEQDSFSQNIQNVYEESSYNSSISEKSFK